RSHRHGSPRRDARGRHRGRRGAGGRAGGLGRGGSAARAGGGGGGHRDAVRQRTGDRGGAGRRDPAGGRCLRAPAAGHAGQVGRGGGGDRGGARPLAVAFAAAPGGTGGRNARLPACVGPWDTEAAALNPTENMATEPATGGSTEYINHHLHHLQVSVGDGGFMTLNVDTLFFTLVLSALFVFFFLRSARKATAGVPGKFQAFVEIVVGFVDGLVRETFHGRSKLIAPLSITIFCLVFLMNFMDMVPVDFLPWLWAAGHEAAGHDPAHA